LGSLCLSCGYVHKTKIRSFSISAELMLWEASRLLHAVRGGYVKKDSITKKRTGEVFYLLCIAKIRSPVGFF
jgi:hypothetical protein